MEIILNGERERVPSGCTLAQVLERLEMSPEVVMVSLNGVTVDRTRLAETSPVEGDRVEILLFMGGGN